jgi:hypothetical protein
LVKKLHIISLDIPYPADYGGVIDIFNKLKWLHSEDVEITLHCFQYGDRKPKEELNAYCKKVYYYPRITGLKGLHESLPYIISSRRSKKLLTNLCLDDAPILFDGIHTTYYAADVALTGRTKIVRAHNIESDYYAKLAENTSSALKKIYYAFEANRLRMYERRLTIFDHMLSISEKDHKLNQQMYPSVQHHLVPAFHSNNHVESRIGSGTYCLYHGNLSVAENIRSAQFLAAEIFSQLDIPLVIAGKDPSADVLSLQNEQIKVIANPDENALQQLIQDAHIHVLPSFQKTGLKLKLLNALFNGRHCIVNDAEIETRLAETVSFAADNNTFIERINELMEQPFTEDDIAHRKKALTFYTNKFHASVIGGLL